MLLVKIQYCKINSMAFVQRSITIKLQQPYSRQGVWFIRLCNVYLKNLLARSIIWRILHSSEVREPQVHLVDSARKHKERLDGWIKAKASNQVESSPMSIHQLRNEIVPGHLNRTRASECLSYHSLGSKRMVGIPRAEDPSAMCSVSPLRYGTSFGYDAMNINVRSRNEHRSKSCALPLHNLTLNQAM